MKKTSVQQRNWEPAGFPGVFMCGLWKNDHGGGSALIKIEQDCKFPLHSHKGWEQVMVLQGHVKVGDEDLSAGDFLFTEENEQHAATAVTECVFYVISENGIEVI